MIVGIGTDIIHIPRIAAVLSRRYARFIQRILTPAEIVLFNQSAKPAEFLAARYAAKEAAAKALGTGFRCGVAFWHISVQTQQLHKPSLLFTAKALQIATALQVTHAHLTLSHEREYAVAFVVLEK